MPYDDTYSGCNVWLQTTSSIPVLASTAGNLGGQIMHQVGEMTRGRSGASEMEKAYLQAPYTQVKIPRVLITLLVIEKGMCAALAGRSAVL